MATYVLTPVEMGRLVMFLTKSHTPLVRPGPNPAEPKSAAQSMSPKDLERLRQKHPNAYRAWTRDDDLRLAKLHKDGATTDDLCATFGRQPGGIRMRLLKLGLCEAE